MTPETFQELLEKLYKGIPEEAVKKDSSDARWLETVDENPDLTSEY